MSQQTAFNNKETGKENDPRCYMKISKNKTIGEIELEV